MIRLPRLIVSSVVRGSVQGDSHGGLYLVDLEQQQSRQVLDWDDCDINWGGRGADRGLRGLAVLDEKLFVAASDELFILDKNFKTLASYKNQYLKHCHEISQLNGHLYLTSTGFDSLLRFDLTSGRFDLGICISAKPPEFAAQLFHPDRNNGPTPSNQLHLNNVLADTSGIFFCGRKLDAIGRITSKGIKSIARLPLGTHNARPFGDGIIFNNTDADTVDFISASRRTSIPVPHYDPVSLLNKELDDSNLARQGFGRGLCPLTDRLIAAGSSPTTVSVHDLETGATVTSINISMDVRNAAHGLIVWPY